MQMRAALLVLSIVLCFFILFMGCSSKDDKTAIGGTWVRFGFEGDCFTLNINSSNQTYQIDFTGDTKWDVTGRYSLSDGQIAFVDTAGQKRCPKIKGIYDYELKDNMLYLSVINDSCSGRAWVTNGDWMMDNYSDLIEKYSQAIALDSADGEAYFQRGKLLQATRDYEKALKDLDRAIALGVERAEAYALRGFTRVWTTRDYEGGLADYDRAIELDPQMARAYFDRGRIKLELDDKRGACQDWEASFELGYIRAENLMRQHCRYILKNRYLIGKYPKRRSGQGEQPQ